MNRIIVAIAAIVALVWTGTAHAQQKPAKREITKIAGDLYRFQNNFHMSVFLVTKDGVIATDPINAEAAQWLKEEIAKRFNTTVKYLIYSHDHRDHIAGGEVFADTATVIAHEKAKADIIAEGRPTAIPDITFKKRMTVELGGQTVHLRYVGPNHSDNMIVMHFPKERTLFAVDFISVKRVAFRDLPDAYLPGWIKSLKRVERMDFDILAPGHGPLGTKTDVTENREYMSDLYNSVLKHARAGKSLDEIKTLTVADLQKYKSWGQFDAWVPLNVEGVYNRVQLHRRGN